MTNKNITLNVWKDNNEFAMAMQGEVNSRFLTVTLEDNLGPINLTDKKVQFVTKNSAGTMVFNNMTIEDAEKGVAVLPLTPQLSAIPGLLSGGEIHITSQLGETLIAKKISLFIQSSLRNVLDEKVFELTDMKELLEQLDFLKEHSDSLKNPHKVTAAQVGALPTSTAYGSKLETDGTTLNLKDQNGNILDSVTTYDTTYSNATTSSAGLMSASDKSKLDSIASGARANVQADWGQTSSSADDYIKNKPTIPSSLNDLLGVLPINQGGTGATGFKDAQKNFHFYTSLDQLNLNGPCSTSEVVNALPVSSIFLLGAESVSTSISDAPTGYGFFVILRGANPNRKLGIFARSLSNSDEYQTGNWFYIMNVSNGVYSWQKILTNISTDSGLKTTSKTIIGAINELYDRIAGL